MTSHIPTVSIDDLRAFHAQHFPHALPPQQYLHGVSQEPIEEEYLEEDDGLGYYPDGTKRTLTDEQIAMFRHSEIQAMLRKRRRKRDEGELSEEGEAASAHSLVASPTEGASPDAVFATGGSADKVESGRIEKPKTQQWATSSARTKAANKRHNQKYRRKKKEERKRQEQEKKDAMKKHSHEDEESDEWDPWHQANGPDVQKDDAVDLDY